MLEYLEFYRPAPLEAAIEAFYRKHRILSPQDIDLEMFAADTDIIVRQRTGKTLALRLKRHYVIFLDRRLPWPHRRVELAHELGHVLMHVGRQELLTDDFRALQEWRADRFAMYALVPTFMFANCLTNANSREQLVSQLAYTFDVPEVFMDVPLRLLEQSMNDLVSQRQLEHVVAEQRTLYDYSFRHPANPRIEYLVKDGAVVHRRQRAEL